MTETPLTRFGTSTRHMMCVLNCYTVEDTRSSVFKEPAVLLTKCEGDGAILGTGERMEVFKRATRTDQNFIVFLFYSFK
jgi:hypothetical protein